MTVGVASRGTLHLSPTTAGAAAAEQRRDDTLRLVHCLTEGQAFALPLDRIAEVVALGKSAAAPRGWVGTLARGADPVPVADLAFLLGLRAAATRHDGCRAVLVREGQRGAAHFGVATDAVPTVLETMRDELQPLSRSAGDTARTFVSAVSVRASGLLPILDADAIIAALTTRVVRAKDSRIRELRALPRRTPEGVTARPEGARPAALTWPQRVLALAPFRTVDDTTPFTPAIPLPWVQEVTPRRPLLAVPHAPAALAGLIAWRGRCLPVIDLRHRLTGHPSLGGAGDRLLIVGQAGGEALGTLLVPGVQGLQLLAAPDGTTAPPAGLDPALVSACLRHDEQTLTILDPAALFA